MRTGGGGNTQTLTFPDKFKKKPLSKKVGQREQGKNFKQRRVFGKYNLECVLLSSEAGRE